MAIQTKRPWPGENPSRGKPGPDTRPAKHPHSPAEVAQLAQDGRGPAFFCAPVTPNGKARRVVGSQAPDSCHTRRGRSHHFSARCPHNGRSMWIFTTDFPSCSVGPTPNRGPGVVLAFKRRHTHHLRRLLQGTATLSERVRQLERHLRLLACPMVCAFRCPIPEFFCPPAPRTHHSGSRCWFCPWPADRWGVDETPESSHVISCGELLTSPQDASLPPLRPHRDVCLLLLSPLAMHRPKLSFWRSGTYFWCAHFLVINSPQTSSSSHL